jgi:signal transduction histidine kinase
VAEDGKNVLFQVSDEGGGVPPSERDRAFERFVRLPGSEHVPGSGLGLAIARSLVELNGGRLRLGDAPSGGALFEIELPRAAA